MTRRSNSSRVGSSVGVMVVSALCGAAGVGCGTNTIDGLAPPPQRRPSTDAGFGPGGSQGSSGPSVCDKPSDDQGLGMTSPGVPVPFFTQSTPVFSGVVVAPEPPPPISGGTLLVLRDGVTAVAADSDRDRVYLVNLADKTNPTLRASIALPLRDEPGRLVEDGAAFVHVVLRKAGAIATIDPVKGEVTLRRQVCAVPRGIAYDSKQDQLHVACSGGELVTFTPTGATPVRTLRLQQDLRDVVVDGDRLIISRFRSAELMVIDANGTMVERFKPPVFTNLGVRNGSQFEPSVAWRTVGMPEGGAMMVHQRGMRGTVGKMPGGYGGFSPCDTIVHTAVTKVKSGSRPVAGPAMPGFVLPVDVAVSPNGLRVAMVAAGNGHAPEGGARTLFVANVDDTTHEWEGGCGMDDKHGPVMGGGFTCSVPPTTSAPMLADGTCPMGFAVCQGMCLDATVPCQPLLPNEVAAADAPIAGTGAASGSTGVGGAGGTSGRRVAGASGGATGFGGPCAPTLPANQEPVAVAFIGQAHVLVQTREPAQLWIVSDVDGSFRSVALSQEGRADTGHAVFHSNSGGGLACASCHPEGHEDGRVWNFECEGDRRTQDLGGGIMGTEPFHWRGDLDSFPTLVQTVFMGRMSGPQLMPDQSAATLKWINSIPSRPAVRTAADAQVLRGKALFESPTAACATCHTGASLTNNKTVDVGTTAAFQVPSLRGLSWRAPFMHDGCAPTLAARFGNKLCDGGDAHGKTSQLTPGQIDDLVAYLESL